MKTYILTIFREIFVAAEGLGKHKNR